MIKKEFKDFIKNCFKTLKKNHPEKFYIPSNFYREIPNEMVCNDKNKWKLIESNISEEDIVRLEKHFQVKLPELYKAFISSYFYLFDKLEGIVDNYNDYDDYDMEVDIMNQTPDKPLDEIYHVFNEYKELLKFGYIPIGDLDDIGPICFDALNNYSLVLLDHEEYYQCKSRDELEEMAVLVFSNFGNFLECFFCGVKYVCEDI
ncbi:SMI1/KNR4 family protein [Clostridium botulinum]|uniref:SMI1/KNR4 family protein n=1 Tax=Clostridium botulinum TaxID=1491 RepID=UPI000773841F|nr:SMI1/KNR4 family protein [Clostridium botulinum]